MFQEAGKKKWWPGMLSRALFDFHRIAVLNVAFNEGSFL